ncbi:bifunctional oligoribonuclease/PAP phosphatase NrnA [Candidatus Microgenomates bacterium]|nr:MAG: bifunctional oligoribonuclease/PAP phosphatase NrnA [Candidatus Microgenomates bacterium]
MFLKKESRKVLSEIKKAKKILLSLHVSPDIDSLTSTLSMDQVLRSMGKETKIISFSQIPPKLLDFAGESKIEITDFSKINFSDFDLFIALDSAQERMITRSPYPKEFPNKFKVINIDHHITNNKYGDINLVYPFSSTAELLFWLYKDWGIKINEKLADLLFRGIMTDTGGFQYPMTSSRTFLAAAELIEKGASLDESVLFSLRSYSFKTLKYWGKILNNMQIDESGKFIWSKISAKEREELGVDPTEIEGAASLFAPVVGGTEFGIILNEEGGCLVRGSLRSRKDFDVSQIAVELGGGGHKQAAGFSLEMPIEEAEKRFWKQPENILNKNNKKD